MVSIAKLYGRQHGAHQIVAVGIMQSITDLAGLYRDPVVAALQGRRDVFFVHELANVIGGCPHRRAISISPPAFFGLSPRFPCWIRLLDYFVGAGDRLPLRFA